MINLTIDNGALNIKIGFTSSQVPNLITQNKFIKMPTSSLFDSSADFLYGDEADFLNGSYQVRYPVEEGRIKDWSSMTKIWTDLFTKLAISTVKDNYLEHNEFKLYFVASTNYTMECYKKILDFVFDTYMVSKIGFGIDSINALYSTGNTTGFIIDSGESMTRMMSVIEGHIDEKSIWQSSYAGRELNKLISSKIYNNYNEPVVLQKAIDHLKSNYFYHSLSTDNKETDGKIKAELPDGNFVSLGNERSTFPDKFFENHPSNYQNICEAYFSSMSHLDRETQQLLSANTFITGGNTMIKNFDNKFLEECHKVHKRAKINIIENPDKLNASFKGSSMLFEESIFDSQLISKEEYKEFGVEILRRKKLLLLC
jgi:centractin